MRDRDSLVECMDAMEDALYRVKRSRDIWQNEVIYWLCRSVWLLLRERLRREERE